MAVIGSERGRFGDPPRSLHFPLGSCFLNLSLRMRPRSGVCTFLEFARLDPNTTYVFFGKEEHYLCCFWGLLVSFFHFDVTLLMGSSCFFL
ncbi:hypothetical protein EUGRSUZ_D00308 [Eucalyptus grandis]|uniref:Uncharacterized protein n=2 Tax=Eucalyptus grandis TaxID=71139 RepID=A0ACC3L2Q5_EUCGR|nr:hypothetical protein EUGRSUZ_D00308 [Eucalyptus grandis]